jgi:hypothetical protein
MATDVLHLSKTLTGPFLIHDQICNYNNMRSATCGAGIRYPRFLIGFVLFSLLVFWGSMFVLFFWPLHILSLRIIASGDPFGIFKLLRLSRLTYPLLPNIRQTTSASALLKLSSHTVPSTPSFVTCIVPDPFPDSRILTIE